MLDFVSFCIDFDFCVGTVRFSGMNLMRKIEHGATPTFELLDNLVNLDIYIFKSEETLVQD